MRIPPPRMRACLKLMRSTRITPPIFEAFVKTTKRHELRTVFPQVSCVRTMHVITTPRLLSCADVIPHPKQARPLRAFRCFSHSACFCQRSVVERTWCVAARVYAQARARVCVEAFYVRQRKRFAEFKAKSIQRKKLRAREHGEANTATREQVRTRR
jgi:hypothetical protein